MSPVCVCVQVRVCLPCACACIRVPLCMSPVGGCVFSLRVCVSVCDGMCVSICGCVQVHLCVFWSQTRSYLCRVITLSGPIAFGESDAGIALELIIAWPRSCPRVESERVICGVLFPDSTGLGCRQYLRSAASLEAKGTSWGNLPGCFRVTDQGLLHGLGSPGSGPRRALFPSLLPSFYHLIFWFIFWPSHVRWGNPGKPDTRNDSGC